jgi:uncharacterized protein (TIGR03382 family)
LIARAAIVCALLGGVAAAAPRRGIVESTTSRWSGDMIVTDVVIRGADGTRTTIVEHGGSVDGIGMSVSHRHVPRAGDGVAIDGRRLTIERSLHRDPGARTTAAATAVGIGVQRTSRSGKPLYHPTGCVNFELDAKGSTKLEGEWTAVDAAFAAWENASSSMACGGVRFTTRIVDDAPEGKDGVNTIHFRDTTWCRPSSGSIADPEVCHNPDAVAVTRVLYVDEPGSARDGEIVEVDIDVNAVGFTLATDGRANAIDVQSAATHEIGHALGLDHNCGVENGAWPSDRDGTPVPSCESVSADLANAVMYVQVVPGATNMRSLKASDTTGLCDAVGGTCESEVTGGCSTGSNTGIGAVFVLAFAALRRRRR